MNEPLFAPATYQTFFVRAKQAARRAYTGLAVEDSVTKDVGLLEKMVRAVAPRIELVAALG